MEIGIIIEHNSSKRNGITKKSYHGPSAGYIRYHCLKPLVSFQILPTEPSTRTTMIWNMNITTVSLSIIASAAVSLGSAVPLLIPDLVSLPV
uniref:Haloacid dehalogenase-like hydrolase family protein n=1 Tax=Arundo donax TaxID=35708 RepID=A0A0A9CDZ3_ARUDO